MATPDVTANPVMTAVKLDHNCRFDLFKLIVSHGREKIASRIKKNFKVFETLLSNEVHQPGSTLNPNKLESLRWIYACLDYNAAQTSQSIIEDAIIKTLMNTFETVQKNVKALKKSKTFRGWILELQPAQPDFQLVQYLDKVSDVMDDLALLHRMIRSPKYRSILQKSFEVIPLPATRQSSFTYPRNSVAWNFTLGVMIKHASLIVREHGEDLYILHELFINHFVKNST